MSLYDDALAAGAPSTQRLTPELIQRILSAPTDANLGGGYGNAKIYTDPETGRRFSAQADYGVLGTGEGQTTDLNTQGPWRFEENLGTGMGRSFDQSGTSTGDFKYDNSYRDLIQALSLMAPAVGGVIGAAGSAASGTGAASGVGNGAFLGEGVASGIGGWDQAFINAGGTLEGAAALSSGVNPQSPDVTSQLQDLAQTPTPSGSGGVQQIEVVGQRMGQTPIDVSAPIGGELTVADLAIPTTATGAATQVADYSNEGRNYPNTQSTQGPGGSPINASIDPANANSPFIDLSNGVVPPVSSGPGTSGNPFGTGDFRNLFDVLSGLYGLKLAGDAANKSDPFGPYRKGYADKLVALENNPGLLKSTPGFMAGQDSISRQMASKGYLGSGNQAAALQRFGGDFYQQESNRLANLAGANIAPGNTHFNAANLTGQALSNIGYGLSPYMGGPR
jgi:hypothetical protein